MGARLKLVLIVLGLLGGVWLVSVIQESHMKTRIAEMPTKTVCVGRFLIDVPKQAVISFGRTRLAGWHISVDYDETESAFKTQLVTKEKELRGQRNMKGWESLESVTAVETASVSGKILVFNRKWGHLFENGERVELTSAEMLGFARTEGASFQFRADYLDTKHVPGLVQIFKQLRPREGDQIPTEPGFCFEKSLIADPLMASQSESTVMFAGVPSHPDLAIALSTTAGLTIDRTLLQRDVDGNFRQDYSSAIHNFRLGERTVNGLRGQELMDRVRERSGVTVHDFEWEAYSKKDSVFTPNISLEMSTGHGRPGEPVQSSLSDVEAIALWDKMLSSLRLRPSPPEFALAAAPK